MNPAVDSGNQIVGDGDTREGVRPGVGNQVVVRNLVAYSAVGRGDGRLQMLRVSRSTVAVDVEVTGRSAGSVPVAEALLVTEPLVTSADVVV